MEYSRELNVRNYYKCWLEWSDKKKSLKEFFILTMDVEVKFREIIKTKDRSPSQNIQYKVERRTY